MTVTTVCTYIAAWFTVACIVGLVLGPFLKQRTKGDE